MLTAHELLTYLSARTVAKVYHDIVNQVNPRWSASTATTEVDNYVAAQSDRYINEFEQELKALAMQKSIMFIETVNTAIAYKGETGEYHKED